MKTAILTIMVIALSGCTQSVIDNAPRYAGARGSTAEAGGMYQLVKGQTDATGCGVGVSEEALHGRLEITLKTPTCELRYEQ